MGYEVEERVFRAKRVFVDEDSDFYEVEFCGKPIRRFLVYQDEKARKLADALNRALKRYG